MFAGHSLGEYAAIAAVSANDLFELEDLLDLMFMRGMTMQQVVKRDSKQRSDYGMVAVDPTRCAKDFTPECLFDLVGTLEALTRRMKPEALLQIVNYNVLPTQYVVAGDRLSLHVLMHMCNAVKQATIQLKLAVPELPHAALVEAAVKAALKDSQAVPSGDVLELHRGVATIPLEGIDVPFHSKLLLGEVPRFRRLLQTTLKDGHLAGLVGRYVPNLVARPFSLEKKFAQKIFDSTQSPVIESYLPSWDQAVKESPDRMGRVLLIELLAYQFAFPVLWIDTTDFLLRKAHVSKVVELGPGPVLKNMLKAALAKNPRFLALKEEIINLSYVPDEKRLFFRLPDQGISAREAAEQADGGGSKSVRSVAPAATAPIAATPAAAAPAAPAAPATSSASLTPHLAPPGPSNEQEATVGADAIDALRVILASRLGKLVDDIPSTATIKQLSGGKSALQNEIAGELGKEFDGESDNVVELPLSDLAKVIGSSYKRLGKLTTELLDRVVKEKLPAGTSISTLRASLKTEYTLTTDAVEGVLLRAIPMAPAARLDEAAAVAWRGDIV